MPIQNICRSPTSISYLRTKSSLPSAPMRNTARLAGTVRMRGLPVRQRHDVRGDEQAAARIDVEGPAMDAVRVDMLDRVRLAGCGVDGKDGERVLAADKPASPVDGAVARGAIGDIGEPAVRVDMHGPCDLASPDVAGFGKVPFR